MVDKVRANKIKNLGGATVSCCSSLPRDVGGNIEMNLNGAITTPSDTYSCSEIVVRDISIFI